MDRLKSGPILQVKHLNVYMRHGKGIHPLLHDISFSVQPGEMLAIVGESGSGKSVTACTIMGLLPSSLRIGGGEIGFDGENLLSLSVKDMRRKRGSCMGYVFQDYQGSFTPFIKVGNQMVEAIRSHRKLSFDEAKSIALDWLDKVSLPADRVFQSYPFQLSGGQKQRAALAAAMMLEPKLLIADEPTTALDVLTGERVMDLIAMLKQQTGCAVLMISHDLRHVLKRADHVAVMRGGQILEFAPARQIRDKPAHAYSQMLLKAKPSLAEMEESLPVYAISESYKDSRVLEVASVE